MKLNKEQQKQLINAINIVSKKQGYRVKGNSIYKIVKEAFVHCDYLIVNSQKLVYRIYIKNCNYDDIFWNVMQIPIDKTKNASLGACGAFKAPSILIKNGELDITDNYEEQAEFLVKLIDECSRTFMERYNIDEYAINYTDGMNSEILHYLAYINMDRYREADSIAETAVSNGNTHDFVNEGKSFFEWALSKGDCRKKL